MGENRTLGTIKRHRQSSIINYLNPNILSDDAGIAHYAMITNTAKTKICGAFSMSILQMETNVILGVSVSNYRIVVDGVLCTNIHDKNAIQMEEYTQQFITAINQR